MAKAPTTFDDLRLALRTEREALTLAVVLPNLNENERVVDVRGQYNRYTDEPHFETDDDVLAEFRRRETPIVPGSDLYRVQIVEYDDPKKADYKGILPVPHGFRCYDIDRWDMVEFVRVDPEDADYDIPYATLDAFGCGNPYYNPWEANRDAFDRDPHLPV